MGNWTLGPAIAVAVNAVMRLDWDAFNAAMKDMKDAIDEKFKDGIWSEKTIKATAEKLEHLKKIAQRDASEAKGEAKTVAGAMNAISSAEDKVATEGLKIMKKSLGFVEEIHQKLVQSSPLLRTIESLFSLAMQLFFMPLGNKLAEVMIPAVVELVNDVTEMWGLLEGKSLGETLEIMVDYGVRMFAKYFYNLANELKDQGSILGAIATVLEIVATMLDSGVIYNLLMFIINTVVYILEHFKEMIGIVVAFKTASLANQLTTMAVIAMSSTPANWASSGALGMGIMAGGTAISAGIGAGVGYAAYNYLDSNISGVDDVTKSLEDYKKSMSSNKTTYITNNFNGVTDANFKKQVVDILNEQNNNYKLRSGFS